MASTYYYSNCSGSLSIGCYLYTDTSSFIPVSGGYYSNGTTCYTVSSSGMITATGSCPYQINWHVSASTGGSGELEIRDSTGTQLLLTSSIASTDLSGYIYVSASNMPYSVTGSWSSGINNIVRYRICYIPTSYEIFYSGDIDNVTGSVATSAFTSGSTSVFLTATSDLTPPTC